MANGCHTKNHFLAVSRRHRNRDEESHANIGHVTKTAIFANSIWRTAAILKIALSQPWIIRFRSNLVCRCKFPFQAWKFDQKNRKFSNSRWRTDAIFIYTQSFFGYILVPYWPINSKFGTKMKNHMQIYLQTKTAISANLVYRCKFPFRVYLT